MAWVAVDKNGTECLFSQEPSRGLEYCKWLNHADREVSARNNMFYDTKTNELLAEKMLDILDSILEVLLLE